MEQPNKDEQVADIISTIVVLDRGRFVIECGRELQELTDAIIETNKAGTLTINLKLSPSGWKKGTGQPNQFDFQPEVKISKPHHDAGKTIFFVTEDHKLTREDPDQAEMFREEKADINAGR